MDRAREVGFRIIEIPELRRSIYPLMDWVSYRRLIETFRELRPDIVHTHSSKAGIIGRYAAAKAGLPAVHTIHGASFHRGQSALAFNVYCQLERWAALKTDVFLSVCDSLTDQYVEAGIAPRDRFTTVYSGMDVDPFLNPSRSRDEVREQLGLQPRSNRRCESRSPVSPQGAQFSDRGCSDRDRSMPQCPIRSDW